MMGYLGVIFKFIFVFAVEIPLFAISKTIPLKLFGVEAVKVTLPTM